MQLGVQLYAFEKEHVLSEPDIIFRRLAEIGYQAIEMPFQMDVRPYMQEYDLQYSALHTGPDALQDISAIIEYLHLNNCQNICISGPLTWYDRSLSNYQRTCQFLNKKAKILKAEGINTHYHNHDFEFVPAESGNILPIDILIDHLEPSLVKFCVDIGWIHMAGLDPVNFLQEHRSRISYVHLRDFLNRNSVALGQGSVDVKRVLKELDHNPIMEWLVVEHEPQDDALEQLSVSRCYLQDMLSL